ncbi:MAG: hypothetical protein A2268_16180 [Candidatus Raymondbacteria bacterium RifOxyA12_full_50_37]|nr:MAG: hypothetical protein A2268_16180 [Candidatus Raymondbacteria bacterium RifOxyA12_full_50_37]OGJ94335.1 MAG: hypothetical protein A2248_14375 [Candidatus Raymondbacteria bacterium RIFOXYA2_FULL_49_16]OGJ95277.1 MAG: hypothetical protein A2453_05800 [Candidatus Raymondbacteria bacterium RIFOXYC2_FULL_50_21]OGP39519.1 MAG: hypothetical protein A2324_11480 [Candidatus Raymondbacteria bacterium RIFOXYB2_FULL_49_35]
MTESAKKNLPLFLTACLFTLSRLLFLSATPYEWDSVNYALALDNFSIPDSLPHPPGYIFYVLAGRFFALFTGDPVRALVAVNIVAGLVTLVFIYRTCRLSGSRRAGTVAALLFTLNPLSWFYGEVAEIYAMEAALSVCTAYFFLKHHKIHRHYPMIRGTLLLGIAGGFRQNTEIFLLPLWFFLIFSGASTAGYRIAHLLLLATATSLWFVPTILNCGGIAAYLKLSSDTVLPFFRDSSLFYGAPLAHHAIMAAKLAFWIALYFGLCLAVSFLVKKQTGLEPLDRDERRFFALWTLPAILFFALVYIAKPGYLLFLLPPVVIAAALHLSAFAPQVRKLALLTVLIILPGLLYFFSPGVGGNEMKLRLLPDAPVLSSGFKRLFRYTAADIRFSDKKNNAFRDCVAHGMRDPSATAFVFTNFSDWSFRTATYFFPEVESHYFVLDPSYNTLCHTQYQYGKLFDFSDDSVLIKNERIFLFISEYSVHASQLRSAGYARHECKNGAGYYVFKENTVSGLSFAHGTVSVLP